MCINIHECRSSWPASFSSEISRGRMNYSPSFHLITFTLITDFRPPFQLVLKYLQYSHKYSTSLPQVKNSQNTKPRIFQFKASVNLSLSFILKVSRRSWWQVSNSLCPGYTKMRLPNLVEHDTLHEVTQQSMSWIPLLNIKCHPDTQLFLCSLFSPVCLERPIYPCRSLCQAVRAGCEGRMQAYGFPWPPMLDCDKFPLDNDMCITSQSVRKKERVSSSRQGEWRGVCRSQC